MFRSAPRTRSRASWQRGVGQADDREARQAGGDVDLDPDDPAVEAESVADGTVASTPPP